MTAQTFETKLIPEDVLAILQTMSPEQRQQVFDFVAFLAQRQEHHEVKYLLKSPVVLGDRGI